MDNVFWVVIAAAVAIALAGIVLYIGSDSLQGTIDDADDTQENAVCGFEHNECDAGRTTFEEMSEECQDSYGSDSCA